MRIVRDGWPWIIGPLVLFGVAGILARQAGWTGVEMACYVVGVILAAFMLYFFRDPERRAPEDPSAIVAGADGLVRCVEDVTEANYLQGDTVRISIFLNPFNVHVNRTPIAGTVRGLNYTPGKHLLTISNASSEYNEHSSILIDGDRTRCLVKQIVGPIVRRVVYWLNMDQTLAKGERIGMMKFGSRMDIYLPKGDVDVLVGKGDRVVAGESVIATIRKKDL